MTAKAEAQGSAIEFEFDGETYSVSPADEWDLDVLENFEDGKVVATVRALVGPEGWALYKSKPRKVKDLDAFFTAIQEALGLGN